MSLRILSPGRINLIGEHIDYNGGYVLPAAIDKHVTVDIDLSESTLCFVSSEQTGSFEFVPANEIVRVKLYGIIIF